MLKKLFTVCTVYTFFIFSLVPTYALSTKTLRRNLNKDAAINGSSANYSKDSLDDNKVSEKSLSDSCNSSSSDPISKISSLGRRADNRLVPVMKSNTSGVPIELVSSSTGKLSFSVSDIKNSGNLLSLFQRFYTSSDEDNGLGKGWSFDYSDRIVIQGSEATLINRAGEQTSFIKSSSNNSSEQKFVLKEGSGLITQGFQLTDQNIIQNSDGTEKVYHKYGSEFLLSNLKMSDTKKISITRFNDGRISKVFNDLETINFVWSIGENPKILSITDNRGRKVSFEQSNGFLTKVTKASGESETYEYKNARLQSVKDQAKTLLLNVEYDKLGRVTKTSDEVHSTHFDYDWSLNSKIVKMTTSEGYSVFYDHQNNGLLKRVYDSEGTLAKFDYDSNNLLTTVSNDKQITLSQVYNQNGQIVSKTTADGITRTFEYTSDGKILSNQKDNAQTLFSYNSNGTLRSQSSVQNGNKVDTMLDNSGRVYLIKASGQESQFRYDEAGNLNIKTNLNAGDYEAFYNALGQKYKERLLNGKTVFYEYNSAGKAIRITDNQGYDLRAQYDESNRLTKIFDNKGWVNIKRDKGGRASLIENSKGQKKEFRYNSYGALTWYRDVKNVEYQFSYNKRGKMSELSNSNGLKVEFISDATGKSVINKSFQNGKILSRELALGDIFDNCWGFDLPGWSDLPLSYGIDMGGFDGCGDPWGNDPWGGGGGGWGGGGGGGGDQCETCKANERRACELTAESCVQTAAGASSVAAAACMAFAEAPPILAACLAIVAASYIAALESCNSAKLACMLRVPTTCSWACGN